MWSVKDRWESLSTPRILNILDNETEAVPTDRQTTSTLPLLPSGLQRSTSVFWPFSLNRSISSTAWSPKTRFSNIDYIRCCIMVSWEARVELRFIFGKNVFNSKSLYDAVSCACVDNRRGPNTGPWGTWQSRVSFPDQMLAWSVFVTCVQGFMR